MWNNISPTIGVRRIYQLNVIGNIYVLQIMYLNKMKSMMTSSMETFSALLAICAGNSPVPGEFPTQRPVARSFDVYFDLRPNKRLS